MDRIMPIDLQRPQLRKSVGGYNRKDVDDLLAAAASSLSAAIDENVALRRQYAEAQEQVERYRAEETLMREALILAQRTADETRSSAHREAEVIREGARQQANENLQDLRRQADDLRWEVERLRLERVRFADEFRALLERYGRDLATTPAPMAIVEVK